MAMTVNRFFTPLFSSNWFDRGVKHRKGRQLFRHLDIGFHRRASANEVAVTESPDLLPILEFWSLGQRISHKNALMKVTTTLGSRR